MFEYFKSESETELLSNRWDSKQKLRLLHNMVGDLFKREINTKKSILYQIEHNTSHYVNAPCTVFVDYGN